MVDIERLGGHSDRGGDDVAGTTSHLLDHWPHRPWSFWTAEKGNWQLLQLRVDSSGTAYHRDKHPYWYLSPGKTYTDVRLTCYLAALVITTLVLYTAFPVSCTEIRYDPSSDPISSFTE